MKIDKADHLFLIIGTNPFPNLLAAELRAKAGGKITLFFTKRTEEIAKSIKDIINEKFENNIKIKQIKISNNYINENNREKFKENFEKALEENNNIIELNYTGGTKEMCVEAHHILKEIAGENLQREIFASYIDGEKEIIIIEKMLQKEEKIIIKKLNELEENFTITVKNIVKIYGIKQAENSDALKCLNLELSLKIYELFKKNDLNKREKIIENINIFYKNLGKIIKSFDQKTFDEKYSKNQEKVDKVFDELENSLNIKLKKDYTTVHLLIGNWLEDYLRFFLKKLTEDKVIYDYDISVSQGSDLEVDGCAIRKYKFFGISTTGVDYEEGALHKLYEIKNRALQLGGREAGVCFICLYKDSEYLINKTKYYWEDDKQKNTLVIALDNIDNMDELITKWIQGGNRNV